MKLLLSSIVTSVLVFGSIGFAKDVDLKKSSLQWHGSKVTGKHYGKIFFEKADVKMNDGKISGGEFVVNMKTFTVDDLEGEWEKKFLTHMKSDDFFEVEKYPKSKLKIKSVKDGKATADLTIKDKTNEVTFDLKEKDGAYTGVLKFDRTKFGMIYGSGDFFKNLGDKMINNEVKVDFKLVLK